MRTRNYGLLNWDMTHILSINYTWDLPKLGPRLRTYDETLGRVVGLVTDNWQITGISAFQSGTPFTPGFSTSDGADITGSNESARIDVNADPALSKSQRTFARFFNTDVFSRPAKGTFGNSGIGLLRGPGVNNWDITISKRIPVGLGERRYFQFRTELYNAFNHTQFSGVDSTARFDGTGKQINANFGSYNAARNPRMIQLSLRFMF
jgi:hypothetical protein